MRFLMLLLFLFFISSVAFAFFYTRIHRKKNKRISQTTAHVKPENEPLSPLADLGYETTSRDTSAFNITKQELQINSHQDLFILYLVAAPGQVFLGYGLIQCLLTAKLIQGQQGIFHYYDEEGNILFSVAQANETGDFNLDNIGSIACQSLVLFLKPQEKNINIALEKLLETAYQLAEDLGGQLQDIQHRPLTQETLDIYKNKHLTAIN